MQHETANYITLIDEELKHLEIQLQELESDDLTQSKNINTRIRGLRDLKNSCLLVLRLYSGKTIVGYTK